MYICNNHTKLCIQYNYVNVLFLCMYITMCIYVMSKNTGNTGSYLTDTGSVYITRDGGLTWEQVCAYVCMLSYMDSLFLLTKNIKD